MKKTYKEKYYELKKENEYLNIMLDNLDTNFNNLKFEYNSYKTFTKILKEKESKLTFISCVITGIIFTILSILILFFGVGLL